MPLTSLPTVTDGSLGRVKSDKPGSPPPVLDFEQPAAEWNVAAAAIAILAEEVGLTDGTTTGSLRQGLIDLLADFASQVLGITVSGSPSAGKVLAYNAGSPPEVPPYLEWVTVTSDPTLGGDLSGTASAATVLKASGKFALAGIITPTALASNTDNWAPTGLATATVVRLTASGAINLTGIDSTGIEDGRLVILECLSGSSIITIKSQSTNSSAANRFAIAGTDIALSAGYCLWLRYDATTQRWVAIRQPTTGSTSPQKVGGTTSGGTSGALASPIDHSHEIGFGSDARGDLPVRGASAYGRLALGAAGKVLRSDGTDAGWGYDGGCRTITGAGGVLAASDHGGLVLIDVSGASRSVAMPASNPGAGWRTRLKRKDTAAGPYTITITQGASESIEGVAGTYTWVLSVSTDRPWIDIVSDGTDYWVM